VQQRLILIQCPLEQHLDRATTGFATLKTRGDDPSVIEDEQIAGLQPVWERPHLAIDVSPAGLKDQ
jgi:hypothetical protein